MKSLIKRPLISEKNAIQNTTGIYIFEVELNATKPEIKEAIQKNFNVKVETVRTSICRGRAKANKYGYGNVPKWKKATVQLVAGEKIALFEGA